MFKTACNNVVWLAGIPDNRQRQPVHLLPIIAATVVRHNRRGHTQCCVHTHSPVGSLWDSSELFGNWLLCLFSCTFPAPLVPRGLNAAQLPPTPWVCPNLPFLFFSPRSSSVIDLCSDCLGSRQPGRTQEVGLGSYRSNTLCICPDSEPTKLLYHPKQNL